MSRPFRPSATGYLDAEEVERLFVMKPFVFSISKDTNRQRRERAGKGHEHA